MVTYWDSTLSSTFDGSKSHLVMYLYLNFLWVCNETRKLAKIIPTKGTALLECLHPLRMLGAYSVQGIAGCCLDLSSNKRHTSWLRHVDQTILTQHLLMAHSHQQKPSPANKALLLTGPQDQCLSEQYTHFVPKQTFNNNVGCCT